MDIFTYGVAEMKFTLGDLKVSNFGNDMFYGDRA